ncbi:hypothetical protein SRABI83_00840 [Arthrobacter sp. Bi83]|nr:hypothetical protein SRABI83_00840 [Arthrobacter sp. Bi83]
MQTCTLRNLLPEGATGAIESDPNVALLKSSAAMVKAIEPAIRFYEQPPTNGMEVETPWADIWLSADAWAEAFESPSLGTPHNEARDEVWEELLTILVDKFDGDDVPEELLHRALARNAELVDAFGRAWPLLDYTDLVGDLWTVPAYLRMCAPWLNPDGVKKLQRQDPRAWTVSDLPLLDAARQRLGDPETSRRKRRQDAALAAARELMDRVVDDLIAADDSELLVMSMLRGQDLQEKLGDEGAAPTPTRTTLPARSPTSSWTRRKS